MLWHEHLRRAAKLIIFSGLHYSGLLGAVRRLQMRDKALVLMYHRVFPRGERVPDYSPQGMSVTPVEFEMQMSFLRRYYDVVPLARIVGAVRGELPFSANMCAVTFDDGWQDVYEHAFPILRRHDIPATIYLTTGFVDETAWFWEERSKYLLALLNEHCRNRRLSPDEMEVAIQQLERFGLTQIIMVPLRRLPSFILEKGREMKAWSLERRDGLMRSLESLVRQLIPDARRPFLNWDEIRDMARAGLEFENHTVTHSILPELAAADAESEVCAAAARIEAMLARTPTHLAYPYGKLDEEIRQKVQQFGVRSATTTRLGLIRQESDPYALNRVNICSDIAGPKALFAARILGF